MFSAGAVRGRVGEGDLRVLVPCFTEHLSIIVVPENISLHTKIDIVALAYVSGYPTSNKDCKINGSSVYTKIKRYRAVKRVVAARK